MADKKKTANISQATGTLPNGLIITYDGSDESIKNSPENQAAQNAEEKRYNRDQNPVPKFTLDNGKVSLSGGKINLSHPVVTEMETALSNAFRGADFTDKDVAAAFQKAATKANEQIQAQLNYEEYEDFLDHSGFSDSAYRNYSSARQEFEKPNVTSSTANVTTYDKNGKLVTKSIKEWFDYWKKEYNPEDRGQLWLKSLEKAYNPTSDEDLYASIPAILMGTNKGQNALQGFFQWINPFDGKGADAPTVTPINGFDDTNGVSVGIQSAVAEFGRILPQTGEMANNPWGDLGATSGEGRYNFKERFGTEFTDADLPEIENEEDFQWYKSLANKSDQELRDIFGTDRIPRQVAVISDPAFSSYENYKEFRDRVTGENAYTAAKSWDQNLQESIERFATYAPNAATVGVAAGQIARIAAEQFALSLLTGGALSAGNIVKSIGDLGVKGGKALGIIKTGQKLAATSSNTAKILSAMATGSAEGLNKASKIIYGLGKIGTWAAREVGEDAIRGIIDDVLVGNSLDSQGNLDGSKFLENVYMNAIMAAIGKAPGTIAKAIFTVLDADKTIDGVKIPVGAKTQLNKLAQAASGSADSAVKAIDEDGHPIITHAGKDERLDQVTLTKENANKLVPEQAPTKTLEEAVAEGDDAGKVIENIAKEASTDTPLKPGDNTKIENAPDPEATKNKIERKLNDDDIRRKFPNGKVSINGEEYILDVKNANLGDLASANGSTIKNFGDGASKLAASAKQGLRSFQESLNGVLQHADEFAKGWKEAVEKFASDNGVGVRDVIIALRDLRIDGTESIPGLKQLWEEHWAPYANQLLDAQDSLTKIKTNRQNYYQRDMVAGTVKIDGGKVSVDQSTVSNLLGIDSDFDLTASSRKANKQKITDDKLETNPELLAKEFVLSRVETIKKYSKQGKIISVMREALDDGEELTQSEAAESLRATKKIGDDIRNSKEVQDIADSVTDQKTLDNVDNLNFEMDAKVNSDPEVKRIDGEIEKQKAQLEELQEAKKTASTNTSDNGEAQLTQDLDSAIKSSKDRINSLENELSSLKEETTVEFDGEVHTIDDRIKEMDAQIKEQQAEVDNYKPKTDPNEIPKMDYATRKELAKSYANSNRDYVVAYRRQNTGVDNWYSNGTGKGKGDVTKFEAWGSDKGDLTNSVWLTTDEEWAESPDMASAGNYNGTPDQTVVVLIPRSLVVDAGGEFPIGPDGNTMSLRAFSEANGNKIVQTRGTENQNWYAARDANYAAGTEPVTPGMLDRLNPKFYNRQELVLFKDIQPELLNDSNRLLLEEYNAKHAVENKYFGAKAEKTLREYQDVMDTLVKQKNEIDAKQAELDAEKLHLEEINKPSEDGKVPESNLREAPWNKKNELGTKGYKYVENNADLPGMKNEFGSVVDWVRKGGNDDAVIKRYNMLPKEVRDFVEQDKNFQRLVDRYGLPTAFTRVGVDFPISRSLIDKTYGDYLWAKNNDVSGGVGQSAKEMLSKKISDGEANLKKLNDERAKAVEQAKKRISSEEPKTEAQQTAENKQIVDSVANTAKATADQRQGAFEKAANKSNAAELISNSSKYKKRAKHQATQNPIGVNFMPGNPFGKFASWINDNFIKSQSIQIKEGDRIYSAYSGGYSLYAESTSWARQIILDIRDGKTLTDAIYKVLQQNGVKVEPTEYAMNKYGAKTSPQKDFEKASAIAERLSKSRLWGKAVKDGKVVNTELFGAMLAKELRRQGASEFFRFLKKSDFSTFTKGQQKWLNAQAYKMIASFDPKASKRIRAGIQKAMGLVMGAKYRSNMYGNLKNAQLQLTEIQRLFTLNGLGDFAKTIKRLITDSEFRTKISDAAYIYASDSLGQGLTKQDVEMMKQIIDSNLAAADASTMTPKGIITAINTHFQKGAKAAIDGADNDLLGAIQGAEYFKNYMLLAGIVQSAETKNLSGMTADAYIRNRFNTEALAGTNIGRIGLTDSALGRLTFMYLGFPIRDLTLQAHIIKGGGTLGGTTKFDKVLGGIAYIEKMLGAKGLVWAFEAPWGYKFADVIGYDPFGLTDNRSDTEDNKNVDFWAGLADFGIQNNPILQGAIGSAFVDVYMAYREAYEDAKDEWLETHDSLEGFEWTLDDAPNEQIWQTFGAGFTPGYTAFSRAANEAQDLDRGFRISSTGNRLYETNQDSGSALWGMIVGRTNTRNAMNYYQTPDPIRGLTERGLPGLGQAFERAMPFRLNRLEGAQYGDRNFREFDPTDSYSYSDWFDGSWADEQNWTTGYYAFREEAEEIRDRANEGVNQSNSLEKIASRETELADLRERVQRYVQAYLDKHPEGISNAKMQQVQRIFNMDLPDAGNTLNRVLGDYSDYEKNYAANRVAQGNFPSPYGFSSTPYTDQDGVSKGDYKYARNAQLENILQTQQYGVQSNVGRVIAQLDNTLVPTPFGSMSFSDYRKKVQDEINKEYSKSKVDYDHISDLQSQYLDVFDMIIRPIFSTYGSGILQAGKSSDVMQQFSSMLNGLIPSAEYRVDKKGRRIRQSTPYMTVDIKKWLQKNYGNYPARNTTDNDSEARLRGIRNDMDAGRVAVARAKAIAFIEDLREGRVSVDRDRLVELQNILRGGYDKNSITGGGNLNTGLNR